MTLITDVKRNALDDGPGIRTVVFFKGCPLRCVWCQNPETLSLRAEIQRDPERCVRCEACVEACEAGVAKPRAEPEERQHCVTCGACVEACLAGARRLTGEAMDAPELVHRLVRDVPFYRRSGGGVTFSGGEPTLHARYAGEVAAALRKQDIDVLIETCGLFGWRAFAEHLLPHVTAIYFDLKVLDGDRHRQVTGHNNRRILENLERLAERAKAGDLALLVRVPLVPGITDDEDNLRGIARHVKDLGLTALALLPYNPLWLSKRRGLGPGESDLPYRHDQWMSADEVEHCRQVVCEAGLEVIA